MDYPISFRTLSTVLLAEQNHIQPSLILVWISLPHTTWKVFFGWWKGPSKTTNILCDFSFCLMPSWCPLLLVILNQCVYEAHDTGLPTHPWAITSPGLRQLAQCAARLGSNRHGAKRVCFDEWLSTFGALFRFENGSKCQFEVDIVVCMLEECFGLPIPRDEWEQIKKSFAVVARKPCATPSRQNKRSLLLPDVAVEALDEFPQQLSGRNKIGSPCG